MADTPANSSISPIPSSQESQPTTGITSRRRKSSIIMPVFPTSFSTQTCTPHTVCVIPVDNPWRTRWDIFIILLALYNSVSVPLEAGFSLEEDYIELEIVGYLFDSFFAIDILVNFRSAYMDAEGKEVIQPKKIAWNYVASGRFIADLLATFPFEILADIVGQFISTSKLKLIKLLKLVRLIRLRRIIAYLHTTHSFKVAMRGITILYILFLYMHLTGCLWVALTDQDTWNPTKDIGHTTHYYSDRFSQYITCAYYGTLLLLGADILPVTIAQVVYSTVFLLVAAILTALIYGHMMVLLDTLAEKREGLAREIEVVLKSLSSIGVSRELQSQVQTHLIRTYDFRRQQEEFQALMEALSPSLRFQISMYLFEPALNQCLRLKVSSKMSIVVAGCLTAEVCKPETTLVRMGDKAGLLFLISAGEFAVSTLNNEAEEVETGLLGPGTYFGEVGILMNGPRSATVTSASFGTYATLPKDDIVEILQMSPSVLHHLQSHIYQNYHETWKEMTIDALQKVPYLSQCSLEVLNEIYYRMEMKTLGADTTLVDPEKVVDCLYVVGKGCLSITFDNGAQNFSVTCVSGGSVCFACSLFYQLPSRVKVVAIEKSFVMVLNINALEEIMQKSPEIRRSIETLKVNEKQKKPLFGDFLRGPGLYPTRSKYLLSVLNAIKQGQICRKLHPSNFDLVKALDEFIQLRSASASNFRGLPQCVKLLSWAVRSTQTAGERLSRVSELTEGVTY